MYTFSNKLKTFSFALIILGLLGVGYGFMTSHKSFKEVETALPNFVFCNSSSTDSAAL